MGRQPRTPEQRAGELAGDQQRRADRLALEVRASREHHHCACGRVFPSERSLRSHRNNARAVASCRLPPELKVAPSEAKKNWRRRQQHGQRRWRCECGDRFATFNGLGAHRGHQPVGSVCRPQPGPTEAARNRKTRGAKRRQKEANYQRSWRAAHPLYHSDRRRAQHEHELERRKRWRQAHPELVREQQRRYRARLREERGEPVEFAMPALFTGHEVLEQAVELVGRPWVGRRDTYDPSREDWAAEAVLAILEGRDPEEAVQLARRADMAWRFSTVELLPER